MKLAGLALVSACIAASVSSARGNKKQRKRCPMKTSSLSSSSSSSSYSSSSSSSSSSSLSSSFYSTSYSSDSSSLDSSSLESSSSGSFSLSSSSSSRSSSHESSSASIYLDKKTRKQPAYFLISPKVLHTESLQVCRDHGYAPVRLDQHRARYIASLLGRRHGLSAVWVGGLTDSSTASLSHARSSKIKRIGRPAFALRFPMIKDRHRRRGHSRRHSQSPLYGLGGPKDKTVIQVMATEQANALALRLPVLCQAIASNQLSRAGRRHQQASRYTKLDSVFRQADRRPYCSHPSKVCWLRNSRGGPLCKSLCPVGDDILAKQSAKLSRSTDSLSSDPAAPSKDHSRRMKKYAVLAKRRRYQEKHSLSLSATSDSFSASSTSLDDFYQQPPKLRRRRRHGGSRKVPSSSAYHMSNCR